MCFSLLIGTMLESYIGNGKGISDFAVNISESGVYSIIVEARHAKGTVYIQQIDGKKAQRN